MLSYCLGGGSIGFFVGGARGFLAVDGPPVDVGFAAGEGTAASGFGAVRCNEKTWSKCRYQLGITEGNLTVGTQHTRTNYISNGGQMLTKHVW